MKPAFALDLDHDSVTLLKRAGSGWLRVDSVELSEVDLDGALARLRGRAEALEPEGFTTKLVLPPSQILYTEVDAPGPDRATRRAAIAEALKDRTPYEVTDLAFDFSRHGDRAKVAVVAQMTLAEAEGFAETYGFNPVCFVAAPTNGAFGGEPFFGLTARAGEHVPEGSHLDRDQEPVRVTGDLPAEVVVEAPVEEAVEEPEPEAVVAEAVEEPVAEEVAPEPAVIEPVTEVAPEPEEVPEEPVDAEAEVEAAEVAPDGEEALEPVAEEPPVEVDAAPEPAAPIVTPLLETVAGRMQAAEQPPQAEEPAAEPVEEAPFIEVEDADEGEPISVLDEALPDAVAEPAAPSFQTRRAASRPDDEDDLRAAENRLHLMTTDPLPDFPSAQVIEGVAAITAPVLDVPALQPEAEDEDGPGRRHRAPPVGRPILKSIPDAAHGTMAQQKLRHAGAAPPIVTPLASPEAPPRPRAAKPPRTTTVQPGAAQPGVVRPGMSSGRVLLALTGILLAAMVAIGLGSAWLSGDETPGVPATPEATAPASPDASAADPAEDVLPPSDTAEAEPLPDAMAPADSADLTDDPPPPTDSATDTAVADALATAPEPDVAPPADVAVTPPAASPLPEADAAAAPVVAPSPATADSAASPALPDAGATASDSPPAEQPLPPPFGTTMKFDSEGRIVPTAEGVITPDGYTLFAGRPVKVPPARPAAAAVPATPAPATTDPATTDPATAAPDDGAALTPEALPPADPALAGKKPRVRPASIAAAAAAAQQKAEAVAEAAAAAAKAEAERLASATPQAVASSRRPAGRPSGLVVTTAAAVQSTAVDAAVAAAVAEPIAVEPPAPAPQPKVVAAAPKPAPEPEPQGTSFSDEVNEPDVEGTPNMPTTRTVAKQATIKNAINLSEVSLIGVYGSSSNRRALVRMPSGRFIKVKVGDRLDGGTIAAIGDSEVSYVKKGRTIILKMSKSG